MNEERSISEVPAASGRLRLWSCRWCGGVAWGLHLVTVWLIAEFGCPSELARPGPLGVSGVAWLALAVSIGCLALGGLATWASWRRSRGGGEEPARFIGKVGLVANPLFMLVIAAQTMPIFFHLQECGNYIK